jgi:RHS repeat-associated protein
MLMPGRQYSVVNSYRYWFNGKEIDKEVSGQGNQYDYGFRIYNPSLGRFLSIDPLRAEFPELTTYQYASNRPVDGVDLDGLEYLKRKSLYELNRFEKTSSNYTIGHLIITNEAIHQIIINHPREKFEEPSQAQEEPKIEAAQKRSSSNRAQVRERNETREVNAKNAAAVIAGIVDFIKWGTIVYYDYENKAQIEYASESIHSLNKADILVRSAIENPTFPTMLKESTKALTDSTNYVTDGTKPTEGVVTYTTLIETWGNLLFNNEKKVLEKTFNFSPETTIVKKHTITTNNGDVQKTFYTSRRAGNDGPNVKQANDLLKTTAIPLSETIKASNNEP